MVPPHAQPADPAAKQPAVEVLALGGGTGDGGGRFRLRIADKKVALVEDESVPPKASVTLGVTDFDSLLQEKVSAMALFMQGKIRLQGDMGEAFRLESLFRS